VITNPPYFSGTPRADGAHHNADVYEWTRACARRLKARGTFLCIVAPAVLDKVVSALRDSKCGKIELSPIATGRGIERVVISARLGVGTGAAIAMPLAADSAGRLISHQILIDEDAAKKL
jgi:tRNA1(Val) A37 N6-methylase TrmN6